MRGKDLQCVSPCMINMGHAIHCMSDHAIQADIPYKQICHTSRYSLTIYSTHILDQLSPHMKYLSSDSESLSSTSE